MGSTSRPIKEFQTSRPENDYEGADDVVPALDYSSQYVTRAMRWQTYDVETSCDDCSRGANGLLGSDEFQGRGYVMKFPANEIFRNIHISEMASLFYNTGSAGNHNENEEQSDSEYPYLGQQGFGFGGTMITKEQQSKTDSPYDPLDEQEYPDDFEPGITADVNVGNWDLLDFATGSIAQDDTTGDYLPWENCGAWSTNGTSDHPAGIGCRLWGLYDSNFTPGLV